MITCKKLISSSAAQKLFVKQPTHTLGILNYKCHAIYPGKNLSYYLYKQNSYLYKQVSILQIFMMKLAYKGKLTDISW